MPTTRKMRRVARDARDGRFVAKRELVRRPHETTLEHVTPRVRVSAELAFVDGLLVQARGIVAALEAYRRRIRARR